jgi:surface antigen
VNRMVAIGLAMLAFPVAAQNWVGLLKNTPGERFEDEDLRLFMDTARKALNDGKDGETLRWDNPATRHRGEITVQRSFDWKSNRCKELRVYNEAAGRKGTGNYSLCSVDGKWRLLSTSQMHKK